MRGRDTRDDDFRTPAVISSGVHVVLLVVAIFGLPALTSHRPEDLPLDVPVVDPEEIAAMSAAPKVGPRPPPQPRELPVKEEATPPPPSRTQDSAPKPEPKPPETQQATVAPPPPPPKPPEIKKPEPPKVETPKQPDAESLKPLPEPPKPEVKKPEPPKPPDPPKPEVRKPEPPKPPQPVAQPAPKPPPPRKTLDDILSTATQQDNRRTPPGPQTPESKAPPQPAARAPQTATAFAAKLTASETAAMADRVRPCWNVNAGARDAAQQVVEIVVDMRPDGTVSAVKIADEGRAQRDATYGAFAYAAQRAVLNPRCQPLPFPAGKYDQLKRFVFRFDPRDML